MMENAGVGLNEKCLPCHSTPLEDPASDYLYLSPDECWMGTQIFVHLAFFIYQALMGRTRARMMLRHASGNLKCQCHTRPVGMLGWPVY